MRNGSVIPVIRGTALARIAALSASTAILALTAAPALAADEAAAAEASDNSGEIIVTAQRREQSILQVPLSVASLSTEKIAALIPGAKLVILPEASHFAMLQAPGEYTAAIRAFIDG